jgi:hypothetical protein
MRPAHFRRRISAAALAACALTACEPNLGNPTSLVTTTRVLAVRGTPPDAPPNTMVHYDLLVASPQGTVSMAQALWSYCLASLPPADNEVVSNACLDDSAQSTLTGPSTSDDAALPSDTCQLFGPDVPSAPPGQPPKSPAIPDTTGGYYQPIRAEFPSLPVDGSPAFGLERIECGLANASADTLVQFNMTYVPNTNPTLASVSAAVASATATAFSAETTAAPLSIPAGGQVTFDASWPVSSAETFPVYDITTFTLSTQRESLRVSWFATAGSFASDSTGRASDDMATDTANTWTAPTSAGTVHFWVVLRDNRGGVDFGSFDATVGP